MTTDPLIPQKRRDVRSIFTSDTAPPPLYTPVRLTAADLVAETALTDALDGEVRRQVQRQYALLEAAFERALARGWGVLEVRGYTPMATELVPAGQRYFFPHLDAVRGWIDAGCPPA